MAPSLNWGPCLSTGHGLYGFYLPLFWVFRLTSSLLDPRNLLGPWHLGLSIGYFPEIILFPLLSRTVTSTLSCNLLSSWGSYGLGVVYAIMQRMSSDQSLKLTTQG